jgi:aryl-alcohol dehydrogenase-like predicted oxidoreductase
MTSLPKRPLGRTGVDVTILGFGAMELRGVRHRNPRPLEAGQEARVLNAVLDAGINFIDTSIDYGASESHIGKAISHRRDEYILATKAGCPLDSDSERFVKAAGGPLPHDFSRANIRSGLEQSLRRLGTDYLDLLQLHISPSLEAIQSDDVVATLLELIEEGKIRFIGSSSTFPNIVDHIGLKTFDAFQIPYSLLERDHEEVIAWAHDEGAGVIVRGGVARGGPALKQPTRPGVWDLWDANHFNDLLDPGQTRVGFTLRFTLSHPGLSTTIIGTSSVTHLLENVDAALQGPLPDDVYAEAKRRLDTAGDLPTPFNRTERT